MGNFYRQSDHFERVCQLHTHVMPADATVVPFELRRGPRKTVAAT